MVCECPPERRPTAAVRSGGPAFHRRVRAAPVRIAFHSTTATSSRSRMSGSPLADQIGSGLNALPRVSFEFFPPKTAAMGETLGQAIRKLEPLQPSFVSVTYGAGGSTRERTHATVKRILDQTGLK